MSDKPNDVKLSGHDYDGIEEFDNPLPRWWLATFYLAILFSMGYIGYYWFGPGPTLEQEFYTKVAEREMKASQAPKSKEPSDGELLALVKIPEEMKRGRAVYGTRCLACHGDKGQGSIGPNLTDKAWVHGGKISTILKTVRDGVSDKGMPPWGSVLTEPELYAVVAYVKSLGGSNPANPKPPQGGRSDGD